MWNSEKSFECCKKWSVIFFFFFFWTGNFIGGRDSLELGRWGKHIIVPFGRETGLNSFLWCFKWNVLIGVQTQLEFVVIFKPTFWSYLSKSFTHDHELQASRVFYYTISVLTHFAHCDIHVIWLHLIVVIIYKSTIAIVSDMFLV